MGFIYETDIRLTVWREVLTDPNQLMSLDKKHSFRAEIHNQILIKDDLHGWIVHHKTNKVH